MTVVSGFSRTVTKLRTMAVRQATAALLLALSIGCSGSPTQPSLLPIGEPFELRMGARAILDGDVRVFFRDVHSDSRCPIDAICARAGEAVVEIALAQQSNSIPPLTLSLRPLVPGQIITDSGPVGPPVCAVFSPWIECVLSTADGKSTAKTDGYTVELRQLAPHPRAGTPVQPGDYVATFVISVR